MGKISFRGRKGLIVTKHGKEKLIGPLLEEHLGLICDVADDVDTDSLGTFSGEIERTLSPTEAAKMKCKLVKNPEQFDFLISNEGSFGSHPSIPFVTANEEIIYITSTKLSFDAFGRVLSTSTNISSSFVEDFHSLEKFIEKIGFPEHGVILRSAPDNFDPIFKGIQSREDLKVYFEEIFQIHGKVFVETDMRSHMNPTRQEVVKESCLQLIENLKSLCPKCDFPCYTISSGQKGLPCSLCGSPTNSILSHKYSCNSCQHHSEVMFPYGIKKEDPMYCNFCNP